LSQAEQSRRLRAEAEQVRAGLLFTLFALLEARTCACETVERSRELRGLGNHQISAWELPDRRGTSE
jgi:hypothetical protein